MKQEIILLEKVFNLIPHALLLVNDEEKITIINEAACGLFELTEEIHGNKICDINNKALLKLVKNQSEEIKKNIKIKGKKYFCRSTLVEMDDFKGRLILLIEETVIDSISTELSEMRFMKEEMDKIIENSYDYIFVTDAQGNVKKINDAYTRITGYKAEEILGENIFNLVKKRYFDRAASIDVIETRKTITLTQTLKSGKTVLVTGNPIFSESGEFIGVVTNGRDITELNRLKSEVKKAEGLSRHYQNELLKFQLDHSGDYIVASPKMAEISDLVQRIARVDSTVLINGESGVGKEIVAREIHRNSLRVDRPYVSVNCAAIPDNLLESELFGYEAGSFTGASKNGKMGIFQLADGGTLFLDEIGELPFYLQAKLLRVIQENEIMRVGGIAPIPIDVRFITATNRDLWKMVSDRQFREDLYYRLNVVQVRIPPLRERKEEIPVFVNYFIGMLNKKYALDRQFNPELIEGMMKYDWPGNIRELRNALEQAFVTTPGLFITDIKMGPQQEMHLSTKSAGSEEKRVKELNEDQNLKENHEALDGISLKDALQKYESRIIKEAMAEHVTTRKAAAALGVSQATIWRKAKQYDIEIEEEI